MKIELTDNGTRLSGWLDHNKVHEIPFVQCELKDGKWMVYCDPLSSNIKQACKEMQLINAVMAKCS